MRVKAVIGHIGQFGEIVEGKEYDSTDSIIARAMDAFPDLFKPTVNVDGRRVETASRKPQTEKR